MSKIAYLWLDIETTGDDRSKDSVLEIACFITTRETLQRVSGDNGFRVLIYPDTNRDWILRIYENEAVAKMHSQSNLINDVLNNGLSPLIAWSRFDDYVKNSWAIKEGYTLAVAGSGVGHFDRPFLTDYFQKLGGGSNRFFDPKYFEYWSLDIGPIRRMLRDDCGQHLDISRFRDLQHRAMSDAENHLEEYRYYKAVMSQAMRLYNQAEQKDKNDNQG